MQGLVLDGKAGRALFSRNGISDLCWRNAGRTFDVHFDRQSSSESTCRFVNNKPQLNWKSINQLHSYFAKSRRIRIGRNCPSRVFCLQEENPTSSFTDSEGEQLKETDFKQSTSSLKRGTEFSIEETIQNESAGKTTSVAQPKRNKLRSSAGSSDLAFLMDIFMRIPAWADALTERGMQKRRTFYNRDDWLRHRSSTRHYRHFKSSFSSRAILSLIPPVGTMTAVSAAVALYNSIVIAGWLPSFIPLFHASSLPYQLTAPALALLLVFRTEASYSRYDETRKTWTKVISGAKDIARQLMAWIQNPVDSHHKKLLLDYTMAFPVALKCHLLYGSDIVEELKEILEEDDLVLVMNSEHRPNCLIQLMTHSLKCVQLEDGERSLLDANLSQFNESISVCERLIRTPIPLSYTRLTSRFLVLWHLTLPVVLWDDCHWMVVPATFISAASLFCIEEVGVLIEEPFPILALDRMCAKACENIQELADLQIQAQEHLKTKTKKFQSKGYTNGVTRL